MSSRLSHSVSSDTSAIHQRVTRSSTRHMTLGARSSASLQKGTASRERTGCLTCRLRRKKCSDPSEAGQTPSVGCTSCKNLALECLGWSKKRPSWIRDINVRTNAVAELKAFNKLSRENPRHGLAFSFAQFYRGTDFVPPHPNPSPRPIRYSSTAPATPPSISLVQQPVPSQSPSSQNDLMASLTPLVGHESFSEDGSLDTLYHYEGGYDSINRHEAKMDRNHSGLRTDRGVNTLYWNEYSPTDYIPNEHQRRSIVSVTEVCVTLQPILPHLNNARDHPLPIAGPSSYGRYTDATTAMLGGHDNQGYSYGAPGQTRFL